MSGNSNVLAPKMLLMFERGLMMSNKDSALNLVTAFIICLIAAAGFGMANAFAQEKPRVSDGFSTDWEHLNIDVKELTPQVYLLHGSGGNTLVSLGSGGTLVVDPEFAEVAPKLKEALIKLHAGSVKYVVDSHYHGDHTGANAAFQKDGAVIVGQENCRLRMTQSRYISLTGTTSPPSPAEALPTMTYDKRMTLYLNGEEIIAFHNQAAHTDGDTIVYSKKANVVHLGDIFVNNLYPYIDIGADGRIDGYLPVIDEVLEMINDKTQVVPGHGPVANKMELKAYRDMIRTVRDRVKAGADANKSLEEILATRPTHEFDAKYATDRIDGNGFVVMVYQSLTGKRMDYRWTK